MPVGLLFPFHFPGRNETLLTESDQIGAAGAEKGFLDQIIVIRIPVLDQCPLHGFFVRIPRNIDLVHLYRTGCRLIADLSGFFPCQGIKSRIVHTGGNSSRRRIKILYLFRHIAQLADIFSQGDGILQGAAGMRGHEVGDNVLLLAGLLIHLLKSTDELAVYVVTRLAHFRQDIVGDMFGRNAQLAADMVLAEFPQKGPVAVRQQVVEAEA